MATVIDSLLIELGLDTSKFDAAQKKSVEELRKFDEQAQKTSKNTQQGSKNVGDGFDKARNALVSLGVAFVGLKGFTQFSKEMTTANAGLGRNAQLFQMSARELDAWGGVLKTVGGDAETFQSSVQAMQQGIAGIKLGDAAILTPLARLGALSSIDLNKGTVDIYKLADALKAFKKENGEQLTYTLAQQLGVNKETYMVLSQGSDAVRRLYDEQYKLSGVTAENTARAQKLQEQWGFTDQALSKVKNTLMDQLYPAMMLTAKGTQSFFEGFVEADKKLDGFLSQLTLIGSAALTLQATLSSLKLVGVSVGSGLAAAFSRVFGVAALLFHSGELNKGEDEEIRKIHEAQDKAMGKTGAKSSAGGLPRNLRNNNPGNIEYGEFAKKQGATGSDGRFAIFPDMKTGENAMANLLMSYAKGGTNTISSIINKWAPGSEKGNKPSAYIESVSKATGIDPNKPLSTGELAAVQKAMANFEGNTGSKAGAANQGNAGAGGKPLIPNMKDLANTDGMLGSKATAPYSTAPVSNSVQTTIGTINVQTQATDANGVALGLNKALQNNSLINLGMQGNR